MIPPRPASEPSPAWADGAYSFKRHGVTITSCDVEPVQTPGCIQAQGALLVLRLPDLVILQASENTAALLVHAPGQLVESPAAVVLGAEGAARLAELLAREPLERNPLYAFSLPARAGARVLRGYDRAMVYKFHPDGHGEIVAESKRADLPSWLGLHYPAEDIPRPAREIFKQLCLRPVPDVSAPLAELVPLARPDTGGPLAMTHCALRGPSVMYTEYLQTMGVAASLTMALRQGDELWGPIACHHDDGPKHVPYRARAACELLAQVASLQLKAAEQREHLEAPGWGSPS